MALFGGTFDPIHEGHIALALAYAAQLQLDRVILMPTAYPPHKVKEEMAAGGHRLEMCRLAAAAYPVLAVSDWELQRGGASFTVDTLTHLRADNPETDWYLLMGADMFLTLSTWWRFETLKTMAVFCTVPRDGVDAAQLQAYAAVLEKEGARCRVASFSLPAVSSTQIRARVRAGQSLHGWVAPAVETYMQKERLYQEKEGLTVDEQFVEIIRGRETPKRFLHSMAVAEEAVRLARRYGADEGKARTAGILHDILKDAGQVSQLQIFEDFDILLDTVEQQTPKLWHARAGALFIERVLGVTDTDILAAVRYHTTARAGMSLLEKVLYLADFTSAERDYPDVGEMRRRVDIGWQTAMEYALCFSIRELVDKEKAIHPDTVAAYNEMMLQHVRKD